MESAAPAIGRGRHRRSAAHRPCPGPHLLELCAARPGHRPARPPPWTSTRRPAAACCPPTRQRRAGHAHRLPGKHDGTTPGAKRILQEQLKHPANQQQTYWLIERLYQLYDSAIAGGGDVSLGSGLELYRAVQKKLQRGPRHARPEPPLSPCQPAVQHLSRRPTQKYAAAEDVADDARRFAFERAARNASSGRRTTTRRSSPRRPTCCTTWPAPRDGLAFLIRRIETEPGGSGYNNQDGWSQHAYTLAMWRTEVKDLGDLEQPLLGIVTGELRRDLHSRQQRSRTMYAQYTGYFWAEKESVFARAADEVWAQDKSSGAACRLHRRLSVRRLVPSRPGDRDPPRRPSPRSARRGGTIAAGPVPPWRGSLRRVDPDPRTAGGPPARQPPVPRVARCTPTSRPASRGNSWTS